MDFIDAKAASTTSPKVASSSDFFTAGLTEKAENEESVKPQAEKSGILDLQMVFFFVSFVDVLRPFTDQNILKLYQLYH